MKTWAVGKCSRMNPLDAIKAKIDIIELAEIGEREGLYSCETVVKEYNSKCRAKSGHIEIKNLSNIGERVGVDTLNLVFGQAQASDAQVLQASGRHLSQIVGVKADIDSRYHG